MERAFGAHDHEKSELQSHTPPGSIYSLNVACLLPGKWLTQTQRAAPLSTNIPQQKSKQIVTNGMIFACPGVRVYAMDNSPLMKMLLCPEQADEYHMQQTSPAAEEAVAKHGVRFPKEYSQPLALLYPVQTGQAASQT